MNKDVKKMIGFGCRFLLLSSLFIISFMGDVHSKGWTTGNFQIKNKKGKMTFIDPDGEPFYSIGMVYAYGPESPEYRVEVTTRIVIAELKKMKDLGFNTLNLYGELFLGAILDWCDENNMAVYFRTKYSPEDYPDFMDRRFRNEVKKFYDNYLKKVKGHPCVLAVDMDQRWMFADVDWNGKKKPRAIQMGKKSIRYLPKWLVTKYPKIEDLNDAWGKNYYVFEDVFTDTEIVKGYELEKLGNRPWRSDIIEYLLWTIDDFLTEITAHMRTIEPNYLITYTTEMPETFVFPMSTKEHNGIDFVSPVHYNSVADYNRDWISAAKLIFHCKFHSDLQEMPVYISETGWRTAVLMQTPPATTYAMARPGDEVHMAELYFKQGVLLSLIPGVDGWSYFKWYDKRFEGDFGFIKDNGTYKPMSAVAAATGNKFPVDLYSEKKPDIWIYHPDYLSGSAFSSYDAYKTMVLMIENGFISEYRKLFDEDTLNDIKNLSGEFNKKIMDTGPDIFEKQWVPFRFTREVPKDNKPVILAGRALEQLSLKDRDLLDKKKTISFNRIGITDEKFNETDMWSLESAGITRDMYEEEFVSVDISGYMPRGGSCEKARLTVLSPEKKKRDFTLCRDEKGQLAYAEAAGQKIEIEPDNYKELHFIIASSAGDVAEKIGLEYTDGTIEQKYLGPTVPSWWSESAFGNTAVRETVGTEKRFYSYLSVVCNSIKALKSVTLPDDKNVAVFSVSAGRYGHVDSRSSIKMKYGDLEIEGMTDWILLLKPGKISGLDVIAEFSNGCPAIVKSRDKKHIAFLFDPLGWTNDKNDVSSDSGKLSDILFRLLKELR
ncbi:MAG: beta-galactosidase [Elusimicrobia bacterium]|nr:beta-galactosidase [Elusimicrobiota bacterium]